jgi:hypothetical protein
VVPCNLVDYMSVVAENVTWAARKSLMNLIYMHFHCGLGTAKAVYLTCCATNRKVTASIANGVNGFFIDMKNFWSHCDIGDDFASNRN